MTEDVRYYLIDTFGRYRLNVSSEEEAIARGVARQNLFQYPAIKIVKEVKTMIWTGSEYAPREKKGRP